MSSSAGLACLTTTSLMQACGCGMPVTAPRRYHRSDENLGFTALHRLGCRAVSRLPSIPAGVAASGARTAGATLPLLAVECEHGVRTALFVRHDSFGHRVPGARSALHLR